MTIDEVQSALPKNTALVEYLRYWHYITLRQREPYFAAIVLFPKRPPAFVPLGKAQEIETLVRRYQTLVRRSSEDEELSRNLSAIYSSVWEPIEHALPQEITRLIISPDGQLNFLGFSTLLTPDKRFLAEKFIVQYAASGRKTFCATVNRRKIMMSWCSRIQIFSLTTRGCWREQTIKACRTAMAGCAAQKRETWKT